MKVEVHLFRHGGVEGNSDLNMKNILSTIVLVTVASCSSTGDVAGIDRPDYKQYVVSENTPTIDGKYIGCTLVDSKRVKTFHVGNGKVSRVFSTFGQADPGRTEFARYETIDLISEDENFFVIGESNRETLESYNYELAPGTGIYSNPVTLGEKCGVGLTGGVRNLKETIYTIRKTDGFFWENTFEASSTEETRDGFRSIGSGGECKLFIEIESQGACRFLDAHPDVDKFLEPYKPKKLE